MKCEYTACRQNAAGNIRLKRYGNSCLYPDGKCIYNTNPVNWVLHSSVEDATRYIKNLSKDEIQYCIFQEQSKRNRKTVISKLEAEKRRRDRDRLGGGNNESASS